MSSKRVFGKTVSDEQTDEQGQLQEDGTCPECEGAVVFENYELVCSGCGLVVEKRFARLGAQFQLKHVDDEEDTLFGNVAEVDQEH